jgi:cobalt-zinc-cadmium efflux system outer membrane protein
MTPIPDPDLRIGVQNNYTSPPEVTVVGTVSLGFAIPIWDRNQGGIIQAQGNVVAASEQEHLIRTNLATTLTTAFNAYENNRIAVAMYRKEILPRQVQGYRAQYERFASEGPAVAPRIGSATPAFADIINSQQTLVTNVQLYLTALGALWQSVADVADVLQTDDLYQIGNDQVPTELLAPVPDCSKLPLLPCCHPCAAPDAAFPSDNGIWQPVAPGWENKPPAPVPDGATTAPKVLIDVTAAPPAPVAPPSPKVLPPAYTEPLATAKGDVKKPVRQVPPKPEPSATVTSVGPAQKVDAAVKPAVFEVPSAVAKEEVKPTVPGATAKPGAVVVPQPRQSEVPLPRLTEAPVPPPQIVVPPPAPAK